MTEEQLEFLKKNIPDGFKLKEIYTDGILCQAVIRYKHALLENKITGFIANVYKNPLIWVNCILKLDTFYKSKINFTKEFTIEIDPSYKESQGAMNELLSSFKDIICGKKENEKYNEKTDIKQIPYINVEFEQNKDETVRRLNENINDCDEELQDLLLELNKIDGLYTLKSTFGNHEEPCKIWFRVRDLKALNDFSFNILNSARFWEIHYDLNDVSLLNHLDFILQTNTSNEKLNLTYINWLMEKLKEDKND